MRSLKPLFLTLSPKLAHEPRISALSGGAAAGRSAGCRLAPGGQYGTGTADPGRAHESGPEQNDKHNQLVVSWRAPSGFSGVEQWTIECNKDSTFASGADRKVISPFAEGDLAYEAGKRYSYVCADLSSDSKYYARVRVG